MSRGGNYQDRWKDRDGNGIVRGAQTMVSMVNSSNSNIN